MKNQKFSKREAVDFGWQVMKKNIWFFIKLLIVTGLLYFGPFFLAGKIFETNIILGGILHIADYILTLIIAMGFIRIILNLHDGAESRIVDLFSQYRQFFRYFFAAILIGFIVGAGFIPPFFIGIITGVLAGVNAGLYVGAGVGFASLIYSIYMMIRFCFFLYFIVDKKAGAVESLQRSWHATHGNVWNLFLLSLLSNGIILLGALALGIGLFAALPTAVIAWVFVYRKLASQPADEGSEA